MSKVLDVSKMLMVKTLGSVTHWHYVDHSQRLMTTGFGTREALEENRLGFLDTPGSRQLMQERYMRLYGPVAPLTGLPLPEQLAVIQRQLVESLRPLVGPTVDEDGVSSDQHAAIRVVVRSALKELSVYDAGGCPLCLS